MGSVPRLPVILVRTVAPLVGVACTCRRAVASIDILTFECVLSANLANLIVGLSLLFLKLKLSIELALFEVFGDDPLYLVVLCVLRGTLRCRLLRNESLLHTDWRFCISSESF